MSKIIAAVKGESQLFELSTINPSVKSQRYSMCVCWIFGGLVFFGCCCFFPSIVSLCFDFIENFKIKLCFQLTVSSSNETSREERNN